MASGAKDHSKARVVPTGDIDTSGAPPPKISGAVDVTETAEEMNSPARETNKEKRWNMYGNGHNRPTSRHEIETWITDHCEPSFANNRAKVDIR